MFKAYRSQAASRVFADIRLRSEATAGQVAVRAPRFATETPQNPTKSNQIKPIQTNFVFMFESAKVAHITQIKDRERSPLAVATNADDGSSYPTTFYFPPDGNRNLLLPLASARQAIRIALDRNFEPPHPPSLGSYGGTSVGCYGGKFDAKVGSFSPVRHISVTLGMEGQGEAVNNV